jgi:Alpha/beta hydrolase of unknown function (DUF900)
MYNRSIPNEKLILSLTVLIEFLLFLIIQIPGLEAQLSERNTISPPLTIVSTRDFHNFTSEQIVQLVDYTKENFNGICPVEMAIYIHGFNRNQDEAGEEFNRIHTSLNYNNYSIPLVGFSWASNTDWPKAQHNAKDSGIELAKFINEFKKPNKCPDTMIRILAHSLGAMVIESTLTSLPNNPISNLSDTNNSKVVKSVHLLGAATDNKLITRDNPAGNAIEQAVDKFYNLYSSQDDGLEFNQFFEQHHPLGLVGLSEFPSEDWPRNYNEINVTSTILPLSDADGDGNLEECFEGFNPIFIPKSVHGLGDNHCGYIGFRQPLFDSLIDDGVMNVVVENWRNSVS